MSREDWAERLRADFEPEERPRPGDEALLSRLVAGRNRPVARAPASSGTKARSMAIWLMAAAIVLVAGVGVATVVLRNTQQRDTAQGTEPRQVAPDPPTAKGPGSGERVDTSAPEAESTGEQGDPATETQREPTLKGKLQQPTPSARAPAPVPSASELFAQATAARRRGDTDHALRLLQELRRAYPASREARSSGVVVGQLLLERGRAAQALRVFGDYLQAGGNLAEEARLGRAVALGQLGRPEAEAAAWRLLLDAHPSTIHAARAKARLKELR